MPSDFISYGSPRAAYVHVPFCLSKCSYCDFNSYPGLDQLFAPYVRAVITEIIRSRAGGCPLDTVYIGGGTPTLLPTSLLVSILSALREKFGLSPDAEVTLEANPGTVTRSQLARLRFAGFNRLSLGVQSFDDAFLRLLGRAHTADQAVAAFNAARREGFGNVSLDLISALPGQTVAQWSAALHTAIELRPEHISAYELTIEDGTLFAGIHAQGLLELPSEDDQVEMCENAVSALSSAGYEHYEVSNFALPGFRSRHNLVYWRNEPHHAFGAGATSYLYGVRAKRIAHPQLYADAVNSGGDVVESSESLTGRALLAESVIQGLRLIDGIDLADFQNRTGCDLLSVFAPEIDRLTARGLVECSASTLKVTRRGLLLLNDVGSEFLP